MQKLHNTDSKIYNRTCVSMSALDTQTQTINHFNVGDNIVLHYKISKNTKKKDDKKNSAEKKPD
jgi:hypothetical protein